MVMTDSFAITSVHGIQANPPDDALNTQGLNVRNSTLNNSTYGLRESHSTSLAVIDSSLNQLDYLLANVQADFIHVLDSHRDGIGQITELLSQYENLSSVQVFSHGSAGQLQLGSSQLNSDTLSQYHWQFEQWQYALDKTADLLFFGCNLASTPGGKVLIDELSQLTGADIAASNDLTGHASLGGDWDLEVTVGDIETELALSPDRQQGYFATLNPVDTTDLIAYLSFDETSGSVAADSSIAGSNNAGTLRNGASFEPGSGPAGGTVRLDGEGEFVAFADSPDLNNANQAKRTVSVWFKVDQKTLFLPNAVEEQRQVIYEEGGIDRGLNVYVENGTLYVGGWNAPESNWTGTYLTTNAIESDTWHHVVLVLDAEPGIRSVQAGAFRAYLDGIKFGEGDGSQLWRRPGDVGVGAINIDTQFHDGDVRGTANEWMIGNIGDLQVYNRALGDPEILELFNNFSSSAGGGNDDTVDTTALVAELTFDETSGSQAADSSPEGLDNFGTLLNGASFQTIGGSLANGVRFDGVDDYVALASNEDLNLNTQNQKTISVWFTVDNPGLTNQKQVIYEEGGFGRGLNIYVHGGNLYVGGWNEPETNWTGTYLSTDAVQANTWQNITLVLDTVAGSTSLQAGGLRAYLDGNLFGEGEATLLGNRPGGVALGAVNVDTQFHDGDIRGTAVQGLAGNIGEALIYNRALTAEEVTSLFSKHDLSNLAVPGPGSGGSEQELVETSLITSLDRPQAIDWALDGELMFIAEIAGVVKVLRSGELEPEIFIDIREQVNSDKFSSRGVTDLAVHPDFENNPYVYLFYAYDPPEVYNYPDDPFAGPDQSGYRNARVIRVKADVAQGYMQAVPESDPEQIVVLLGNNSTWDNLRSDWTLPEPELPFADPFSAEAYDRPGGLDADGNWLDDYIAVESNYHNTGSLEFGPDGALYVSLGDGTFASLDPRAYRSQDLDNLSGKILRIDPISGDGLPDNPFFVEGLPETNQSKVYQYGLRNPFRITIDPTTGQIYTGDTGWEDWDEVNTGAAGDNFGWPHYEGGNGTNEPTQGFSTLQESLDFYASGETAVAPIFAISHVNDGSRAIVMGDLYSGTLYPEEYQGDLFFVDPGKGIVRNMSFDENGDVVTVETFTTGAFVFSQIVMGPDENLYYVDLDDGLVGRWEFV
jgi:glucose/arabinose dehydrogenase